MKNRLQQSASKQISRCYTMFSCRNSPVKILTRGRGRGEMVETRLFLKRDQKREQAKCKALEI